MSNLKGDSNFENLKLKGIGFKGLGLEGLGLRLQQDAGVGADPLSTTEQAASSLLGRHASFSGNSRKLLILEGVLYLLI